MTVGTIAASVNVVERVTLRADADTVITVSVPRNFPVTVAVPVVVPAGVTLRGYASYPVASQWPGARRRP